MTVNREEVGPYHRVTLMPLMPLCPRFACMVRGFDDEKWRKMQDSVVDPLTGQPSDMRFQSKNVVESDPGSNHNVPKSNHDEDGERVSEQDENTRTDL